MAIKMVFGVPGSGKSAFMTFQELGFMGGAPAFNALRSCNGLIRQLNDSGFKLELPSVKHLAFSDWTVLKDPYTKITNNEIDGFRLGLPNKRHDTLFIPPFSKIFLDEAQKYLNSRRRIATYISRFYEMARHFYIDILLASQRPALIDLNVRELADTVIKIERMEHEYKHEMLTRTEWIVREFENCAAAIRYIESGEKGKAGEKKSYVYDGNIFRHYDAHNFFPLMFKNKYETTYFDVLKAKPCGMNLQDIKRFNLLHDYEVPKTFYEVG